jgi:hypothetical protein
VFVRSAGVLDTAASPVTVVLQDSQLISVKSMVATRLLLGSAFVAALLDAGWHSVLQGSILQPFSLVLIDRVAHDDARVPWNDFRSSVPFSFCGVSCPQDSFCGRRAARALQSRLCICRPIRRFAFTFGG